MTSLRDWCSQQDCFLIDDLCPLSFSTAPRLWMYTAVPNRTLARTMRSFLSKTFGVTWLSMWVCSIPWDPLQTGTETEDIVIRHTPCLSHTCFRTTAPLSRQQKQRPSSCWPRHCRSGSVSSHPRHNHSCKSRISIVPLHQWQQTPNCDFVVQLLCLDDQHDHPVLAAALAGSCCR